jgi:orotate phosphoribosyltransferase
LLDAPRTVLIRRLKESRLEGDFINSALESVKFFFPVKALCYDSSVLNAIGEHIQEAIEKGRIPQPQTVVGIGWKPASMVLAARTATSLRCEIGVVETPRRLPLTDTVRRASLAGHLPDKSENCLIMTDVVVTGDNVRRACNALGESTNGLYLFTLLDFERPARQLPTSLKGIDAAVKLSDLMPLEEYYPDYQLAAVDTAHTTPVSAVDPNRGLRYSPS